MQSMQDRGNGGSFAVGTLGLLFALSFVSVPFSSPLAAQDGSAGHGASTENSAGDDRLEPWQEAQLVNNPWTAPRREGWNLGLEDVGNPHLREGTLLEDLILPAPDRSANDARRARALNTFASRTIDWSAPPAHLSDAAPETAPRAPVAPQGDANVPWIVACLLGGAIFLWWRRR